MVAELQAVATPAKSFADAVRSRYAKPADPGKRLGCSAYVVLSPVAQFELFAREPNQCQPAESIGIVFANLLVDDEHCH